MSKVDSSSPPPEGFLEGIKQFNQGDYYACHDTLEAIWMEAEAAEKPFFQGILQIAVALYHLGNHNWKGAAILFGEGLKRLEPFEPTYYGVDVVQLVDCGAAWLETLQVAGPTQVAVIADAIAPGIHPIEIEPLKTTLPALHISTNQLPTE
ncbi:MAG TPA: DUF309 domain-containing protein [Trichocoleus sp.]